MELVEQQEEDLHHEFSEDAEAEATVDLSTKALPKADRLEVAEQKLLKPEPKRSNRGKWSLIWTLS